MAIPDMIFVIGGGWVLYWSPDLEPRTRVATDAVVRFEDRDGRLVPTKLDLTAPERGLSTELLRKLPLGRLEAWVNSPDIASVVRADLAATGPTPNPDVEAGRARVKEYYDSPPGEAVVGSEVFIPPIAVPTSRDYGDDFYRQVARAYADAAQVSRRPAAVIAELQEVPVATVHRWIAETRRRKFLPPGRPGKAG